MQKAMACQEEETDSATIQTQAWKNDRSKGNLLQKCVQLEG
jgi:hypothetical protein